MKTIKKTAKETIDIIAIQKGRVSFHLVGTTPIILHRLSEKAKHELLYPEKGRDKEKLKHDPLAEYRNAPYRDLNPKAPTLLQHLSAAFKCSMRNAALDLSGVNKREVGRLCWVEGERISLYGVPQLIMSPVRSSDMNRTPDIRTRAIIPKWAAVITVTFIKPNLNEKGVMHLLAAAGMSQGIGDWRTEKGAGTYGSFKIVEKDDPEFTEIVRTGGRSVQTRAMETPDFYDIESEELFRWFEDTIKDRGDDERATSSNRISNGQNKELTLKVV